MKKILAFIAVGALALSLAGCSGAPKEEAPQKQETASEAAAPAPEVTTTPEASAETPSQKSALKKADSYFALTGFSHTGLISQLEFEKFSTEDATYAADNCGADWNEQAAKKAAEYTDLSSFSHDALVDQLVFEGFTPEQAAFGADSTGL